MKRKLMLIVCMLGILSMSIARSLVLNDGLSIIAGHENVNDKSSSISASINGHDLTVIFLNNIGNVTVKITTAAGIVLDSIGMMTPNGYIYYIPNAGNYIVTFILENGDEYYGEFTVTE
jgi:hypothetical protein